MKKIVIINVISLLLLFLFTGLFQLKLQKDKEEAAARVKTVTTEVKANNNTTSDERKVVLLLGSSVTQGIGASVPAKSWAGLLNGHLSDQQSNLVFLNLAVGGYTTKDVVHSSLRISSNLNTANLAPDLIIFENCLINDFQKLTVSQAKKNIQTVITRLGNQFPNAQIYLTPPNDVTVYANRVSLEGLSYQNYVKEVGDYSRSQEWNYIDFWESYQAETAKRNISFEDTLVKDGKHPNDTGYDIWFEVLKQEIDFSEL